VGGDGKSCFFYWSVSGCFLTAYGLFFVWLKIVVKKS